MYVNPELIEVIERWLNLPRVVLLYLPLPVIPVMASMGADSNTARAMGWAFWISIPIAIVSVMAGSLAGSFVEDKDEELFFPAFHAAFIVTWLLACCALWCG